MTWQLDEHQLRHRVVALRRLAARYDVVARTDLNPIDRCAARDAAAAARELADEFDPLPQPTHAPRSLARRPIAARP